MYAVLEGNPGSGFEVYGPFESEQAAIDWADATIRSAPWWVMRMTQP
jgi:hypothetical protein